MSNSILTSASDMDREKEKPQDVGSVSDTADAEDQGGETDVSLSMGRRMEILIKALRLATLESNVGLTYITTETADLLVIPLATFNLVTDNQHDHLRLDTRHVSDPLSERSGQQQKTQFGQMLGLKKINVGERRYAIWQSTTYPILRRKLRDSMANSKWNQLDRLIGVIPPGGSLGLDDKSFVFPSSSGCGWTEDEMVRYEAGLPVRKFKDPRVVARCLVESQIFQLNNLIKTLLGGPPSLLPEITEITVLSDWIGPSSIKIISQILDIPLSHHALLDLPTINQSRDVSTPTNVQTQQNQSPPQQSSPRQFIDSKGHSTPTPKKDTMSAMIKHGLPTPPDSAFGNSRVGSLIHLHDIEGQVEVGRQVDLDNLNTPSSVIASDDHPSSPDSIPPSLDSSDAFGDSDDGASRAQPIGVLPSQVDFSSGIKVDERRSWERGIYPAIEVEYNRLRIMVDIDSLYPPPPELSTQILPRIPAFSRVLGYEPRRGSVSPIQPLQYR